MQNGYGTCIYDVGSRYCLVEDSVCTADCCVQGIVSFGAGSVVVPVVLVGEGHN